MGSLECCGLSFFFSADNLNGDSGDNSGFKYAVHQQVRHYCQHGLPEHVEKLRLALCHFYGTSKTLKIDQFDIEKV